LPAWFHGLVLIAGLLGIPRTAPGVSLAWNPNTAPGIAGYRLYYGSASGSYSSKIDVGNATATAVPGLTSGKTYFFAATAYNSAGLESGYSGEVSYTVPATNGLPSIVLSSPSNGATYTAPASLSLVATVTANGHSITKVQFYNGATLLGSDAAAPYSFSWTNVAAGSFSLKAVLTYDTSTAMTSGIVNVTVTSPLPVVVLTAPLNGAQFTAPATVNLSASVTPNGHTISKVQFYNSSSILGEAVKAPYSFAWTNVGAGNFNLMAKVLFDSSGVVSSGAAGIVVNGLPLPWQTGDIGPVAIRGSAAYSTASGIFTVAGSGLDIWNTSDQFRFVWQTASGDCDIRARVQAVQNTNPQAKAGVMIRETLNGSSRFVDLVATPGSGASFGYRTATGGSCSAIQSPTTTVPCWVRVVRSGNTFKGYVSTNGTTWSQVGSVRRLSMANNVYIGMCVTSHNNALLNTSSFSNVTAVP
jgi:hypothetical protein